MPQEHRFGACPSSTRRAGTRWLAVASASLLVLVLAAGCSDSSAKSGSGSAAAAKARRAAASASSSGSSSGTGPSTTTKGGGSGTGGTGTGTSGKGSSGGASTTSSPGTTIVNPGDPVTTVPKDPPNAPPPTEPPACGASPGLSRAVLGFVYPSTATVSEVLEVEVGRVHVGWGAAVVRSNASPDPTRLFAKCVNGTWALTDAGSGGFRCGTDGFTEAILTELGQGCTP